MDRRRSMVTILAAQNVWQDPWLQAISRVNVCMSGNMQKHVRDKLFAPIGARVWRVASGVLLNTFKDGNFNQ